MLDIISLEKANQKLKYSVALSLKKMTSVYSCIRFTNFSVDYTVNLITEKVLDMLL